MSVLELKAYDVFKAKLGEKEAEIVIDYLESMAEEKYSQKKDLFLTKDDKGEIVAKIEQIRSELNVKVEQTKSELNLKIEQTNVKIEQSKTEMIRWFFAFFIAIMLMIAGLYLKK